MEGALGERLKTEYGIRFHERLVMAALVEARQGRSALKELWQEYGHIAIRHRLPFIATTPTRRLNADRLSGSGHDASLAEKNVALLREVQEQLLAEGLQEMYIGGMLGCRGDAYTGEGAIEDEGQAERFHAFEAELFAAAGADFLYAALQPNLSEAAGMALAMAKTGLPYIISFTLRRDGRLIDGSLLTEAIDYIDNLVAERPLCYMANCVHPRFVYEALSQPFNRFDVVRQRFCGIQANAAAAEYDVLEHGLKLPYSGAEALAEDMLKLRKLCDCRIFGGCCGTDGRHMEAIAGRLTADGAGEDISAL
ncbi:homocysteine S-methyltransferase family protein [Anaerovibrio sp.]|uniref:homocysteine S-methyltransferase family protein n=1 Tax=Anaerovibrio sp. TaxID=1872532 RepID=UPI003F1507DC